MICWDRLRHVFDAVAHCEGVTAMIPEKRKEKKIALRLNPGADVDHELLTQSWTLYVQHVCVAISSSGDMCV